MDLQWVAIAMGDVTWIALAFVLGILATLIRLPPLVGFLAAGFILNYLGYSSGEMLEKLSDLGITLLLFTVGLKLNLKVLTRPQVWAVTTLHIGIIIALFGSIIFALAFIGVPLFSALDFRLALMIALALSFSSTVFVVKSLEDKGEMKSLHGRIAIGILVMQDLVAVAFLAASTGTLPALWAPLLLLLIPMRPLLIYILKHTGHGELMILYGLVLALGGTELFEIGGIKDDLGALFMGILISGHPRTVEMAKSMMGFKDLFLLGFFLSIGMTGTLSLEAFIVGLLLVPFILFKSSLFFWLLTRFRLRARTSLLASLNLSNYSEFGLIVIAIAVSNGWIDAQWLMVFAIALALSFVIAAPLNRNNDRIYTAYRGFWSRYQSPQRLSDDGLLDTFGATIAIFGMGRVGSGAYDKMRSIHGETVVGVDFDAELVRDNLTRGRHVLHADPSDADFWDKVDEGHKISLIMLALPNLQANLDSLEQLHAIDFKGKIAATARYPDERERLREAGATSIFDIYTEAGTGFADLVESERGRSLNER